MDREHRRVRYAVRRRLCWKCFKPLTQHPLKWVFVCLCGREYPAVVLLQYEDDFGRVGACTLNQSSKPT